MTLVKFSNALPSLVDRFIDSELMEWPFRNLNNGLSMPSVNIREDAEGYELEMAAPGLQREHFKIELDHNKLTISSEKKEEKESKENQRYTRREFSLRSFSRSFTLPEIADAEKINAKYENGILRIAIPKKEEAKPRPAREIAIS